MRDGRNGGKIYTGGVPGNRGGGRPSKQVHQRCAKALENMMDKMELISTANHVPGTKDLTTNADVPSAPVTPPSAIG